MAMASASAAAAALGAALTKAAASSASLLAGGAPEGGDGRGRALALAGGAGLAAAAAWYAWGRNDQTGRVLPSSRAAKGAHQFRGGSLGKGGVKAGVEGYHGSFSSLERGEGARMAAAEKVAEMVDTFYSLVTDLYEWGWGQSFHFSPYLGPGRDWAACEAAHEARIAALLGLCPGKTALDVGCGVGGPMRFIAAFSGGNVHGVTINAYQVERATLHNARAGLSRRCTATRGNFLELTSFLPPASFDGAYAIEATCHAPRVEDVYAQVYDCLKPGAVFVVYEWVTTKHYDASNRAHVALIDEIVIGNGLPGMRTYAECEAAARAAGFEVLEARDLAVTDRDPADVAEGEPPFEVNRWYWRLGKSSRWFRVAIAWSDAVVRAAEAVRLAPRGMARVHRMLVDTAAALIDGGEAGIFTPTHMIVMRKPKHGPARSPLKRSPAKTPPRSPAK